jgi:hypothetical protein
MYVNEKSIPTETVQVLEDGGWRKELEGVNSSMIYLIHCKNFYKCYDVHPQHNKNKQIFQKFKKEKILLK